MGLRFSNTSNLYATFRALTYDADAQLFITTAQITNPTQQSAINALVSDLKSYNIWTKMKAIYPFVGGTATKHKWNLKNPADINAAFRLQFFGGWTHSSTGITGNTFDAYADTFLAPSTSLLQNDAHISLYSRTNFQAAYVDMGTSGNPSTGINGISIQARWSDGNFYGRINALTSTGQANTDSRGFFVSSRLSSTIQKIYKNNITPTQGAVNSTGLTANTINIGRWNNPGGTFYYSPREFAFASIGDGLTDTEAANFYTAVQAYQTTLGRQV